MKFFVDTADVNEVRELDATGMVDGVTTNPSLVARTGRGFVEVLEEMCDVVSGPVSAEVTATEAGAMEAEGRKLARVASNIAVKVPLTWDGLKACRALSPRPHTGQRDTVFFRRAGVAGGQGGRRVHLPVRRTA